MQPVEWYRIQSLSTVDILSVHTSKLCKTTMTWLAQGNETTRYTAACKEMQKINSKCNSLIFGCRTIFIIRTSRYSYNKKQIQCSGSSISTSRAIKELNNKRIRCHDNNGEVITVRRFRFQINLEHILNRAVYEVLFQYRYSWLHCIIRESRKSLLAYLIFSNAYMIHNSKMLLSNIFSINFFSYGKSHFSELAVTYTKKNTQTAWLRQCSIQLFIQHFKKSCAFTWNTMEIAAHQAIKIHQLDGKSCIYLPNEKSETPNEWRYLQHIS